MDRTADTTWDEGPGLLDAALRYWWLLVLFALVGGAAGYGLTYLQPVTYQAAASLLLADPGTGGIFDADLEFADPSRYVRNQAERIQSSLVARIAAEQVEGYDGDDIQRAVDVHAEVENDLVTITATATSAEDAAGIANAVGDAYEQVVRDDVQERAGAAIGELDAQAKQLQGQLNRIDRRIEEDPENSALEAQRDALVTQLATVNGRADQLRVDASLYGTGVELFERAEVPVEPAGPRRTRAGAVGALFGLVCAAALAWWLQGRSEKADERQDPAAVLGAPLLGTIPDFGALRLDTSLPTVDDPRSPAAEAYQFVVSSLLTQLPPGEVSAVLLTSPLPADGKTVTAVNIAVAASRDGREVLLVDADSRVRGLSRLLGADSGDGLRELQQDPAKLVWAESRRPVPGVESLEIVPAGGEIPDPAGFFRTRGFSSAMRRMRDQADLVLIDSPPLLAVSDASAVAPHVDGIVLVVNQGTPLSVLAEVRDRLALVETPLLGYVFNRASAKTAPYAYYRYEPETRREEREKTFATHRDIAVDSG